MKIPRGYIIAVEGIDAVGKKTQSALLFNSLARRLEMANMSFPDYRTPIGREIKSFLSGRDTCTAQVQHLLFAANRWEKHDEILSHLREGELLVINRYTESNIAYGVANGLKMEWLANLEKGLPRADLVLVLDAPTQSIMPRRPEARKDFYEKDGILQRKAQKAYKQLAPKLGWELIDARGSVREVQKRVLDSVKQALARDRGVVI